MDRAVVDTSKFNPSPVLPYELRIIDFQSAMQDVYDFLFDVNTGLAGKGLPRLEYSVRQAVISGLLSDLLTASVAKHSRALVENKYHNGHPDLLVRGVYPNESVSSGTEGIEIKSTLKVGGAVDVHGARAQWMCVFVYHVDRSVRADGRGGPLVFREVYLGQVGAEDFRRNPRGELGTRTATLDRIGIARLRRGWIYRDVPSRPARARGSIVGAAGHRAL